METGNAPSVLNSTPPPSQQKHRAASLNRTRIRRPSSRTLSNESGLLCSRTVHPVRSSTSNSASVSAPTKWWRTYYTYITTHSKYHGHRQRRNLIVVHHTAPTHTFPLPFHHFLVSSLHAPLEGLIIGPFEERMYQGGKQYRRVGESLDVLLDDHSTCFQDPHAAPPWSWHVK